MEIVDSKLLALKHTHTHVKLKRIVWLYFRNTCVHTSTHMCVTTKIDERSHKFESAKGYIGGLGRRKGKGEISNNKRNNLKTNAEVH